MDEISEAIYSTIHSSVDEIGIVFTKDEALVLQDQKKLGIPVGLLGKLKAHIATLAAAAAAGEVDKQSFLAVVCSGDDYSSWAKRKQLLVKQESTPAYEIRVLDLILSKQPKSGGAWEHRRFVAERAYKSTKTVEARLAVLMREIEVCERVCIRHPRTYYAWAHRNWVCNWMTAEELEEETQRVKRWISRNLSDGSAFNHLDYVYRLLFERSAEYLLNLGKRIGGVMDELEWCSQLSLEFPGHESIWMYRRACARQLASLTLELANNSNAELQRSLSCVELHGRMEEKQRFSTYNWWRRNEQVSRPNVDALLQVLLDEAAYGVRLGLWERCSAAENDFVSFAEHPHQLVLRERKHALAYGGWLANYLNKHVFEFLRKGKKLTKKVIGPGCLAEISLRALVGTFDKDTMDREEFILTFQLLTKEFSLETVSALFDAFDVDQSGELSRTEFLSGAVVLCGGEGCSEKVRTSFELLDTNNNGFLDRTELFRYCVSVFRIVQLSNPDVFQGMSLQMLAQSSVDAAFQLAKTDKNGLSFHEFRAWLTGSTAELRQRASLVQTYEDLLNLLKDGSRE